MSKFKVGDIVVWNEYANSMWKGMKAEVVKASDGDLHVKFLETPKGNRNLVGDIYKYAVSRALDLAKGIQPNGQRILSS